MSKYLYINQNKLAFEEMDTLEELKQSILSGSTIRSNGTIDKQASIHSRTVYTLLNCLGYK